MSIIEVFWLAPGLPGSPVISLYLQLLPVFFILLCEVGSPGTSFLPTCPQVVLKGGCGLQEGERL